MTSKASQLPRPSMAPSAAGGLRYSLAPGRHTLSSTQGQASPRLAEKQRELDSLMALRQVSATLVKQFTDLEQKMDTMCQGTESVASVLSSWQNVFRAINIAGQQIVNDEDDDQAPPPNLPEPLVRIPTDPSAMQE